MSHRHSSPVKGHSKERFIIGDIENAYLTVSRPASEDDSPTYVRSPPDYPQFLTYLRRLQKAIYGLKDSVFIFEGHRDRALMEAGWIKSGVPGLWWKWTGKPGAAGSRLISLCATFVDDLAILGISVSPSTFVAEIARKGPFSIKETHPTDEGKVRWAGVDFKLKKDKIRISQSEYLQSLGASVPEGPVPSIPLPPNFRDYHDTSPPLSPPAAKQFRSLLGGLA
uniref:Uncharacterized protein n=1 Tax=Chromera velia CCMP2878 TaxID=1169474 RepID=A0A0G4HCC4_9ALVE|eukprot:Cvel_26035.t1-p1 / transcript=Cvel_26035.t1 / gene=Cvel_26035 / organism=Chromera_velia_CCMP2878 / gene_product=hypothetical protein / transcript_product=hypothetical protein / location=Cvel_scaffold3033:8156-8990(-) / protein_length=223 / sequence_SO=supercontig / SO=protein_coding / is_pseudo=false